MKEWNKELRAPTAKTSPAFRVDGEMKTSANLSFGDGVKKMETKGVENCWSGVPTTGMEKVREHRDCLFARLAAISADKNEQAMRKIREPENLPLVCAMSNNSKSFIGKMSEKSTARTSQRTKGVRGRQGLQRDKGVASTRMSPYNNHNCMCSMAVKLRGPIRSFAVSCHFGSSEPSNYKRKRARTWVTLGQGSLKPSSERALDKRD